MGTELIDMVLEVTVVASIVFLIVALTVSLVREIWKHRKRSSDSD